MPNDDRPVFFIPEVPEEKQEECYAALAGLASCAPLPPNERIYSISFRHNGEFWTATVGEQLRGTKTRVRTVRGTKVQQTIPLWDGGTVIAIFPHFPGLPFRVWLNGARSAWTNPFLAGNPTSIIRFASKLSTEA